MQNKHILVVEDDEMSYIYINQILSMANFKITRVKTGIDAIEYCKSDLKPDLILMDIQLPDMDGKTASSEIRKENPSIPIIAQTASKLITEKDRFIKAGCNDLLTKPFSIEELMQVIERHL